jgi:membrane-associated protein
VLPNLDQIILTFGYLAVFGIVFAESGLLVGFFLPGDSLLFTAGFLTSQPDMFRKIGSDPMNPLLLALGAFAFAVIGDSVGYAFGSRVGRRLFQHEDSLLFHKRHLLRAEAFYEKHGGKAIVLARFMPVVRTFAPIVAGMGKMRYERFLAYNVIGGALWGAGVSMAGYYFGRWLVETLGIAPENVDKILLPVIALIIVASVAPPAIHLWRESGDDIRAWVRRRLAGSRV